jgi:hypothetical protein
MAVPNKSPSTSCAETSGTQTKGIKEFLHVLAPEKKTLAAIRATARKNGKSKLSLREINREIRTYRRQRQP